MSPPKSELLQIQDIPGAGRGVIALTPIRKDTIILCSERPAAYVVFREFRKEVCAQCFLYNRGRTLSIRNNEIGKVFCTVECQREWLNEQGEHGLAGWKNLHNFIQSRSKAICSHSVPLLEEKPDLLQIEKSWAKTHETGQIHGATSKNSKNAHRARSVDPDVLSYLLSGVIFHHNHTDRWQQKILDLTMDERPYRDSLDLEAHCSSFIQLADILPEQLSPSFTTQLSQTLISATGHNSFGIRSGSDEGEEYLGYALYPEASYFNHSCAPNIAKKRIGAVWQFLALRDIEEGEQCCITYLGGDEKELTVTARRARLRAHWGFQCMCDWCSEEATGSI